MLILALMGVRPHHGGREESLNDLTHDAPPFPAARGPATAA